MRLIDADALIEDINTKLWDWDTVDGIMSSTVLKQTITDIGNAPTIDPVRHGRWIERCEDQDGIYEFCSECGIDTDITHYGESYAYCPNCGAKMDGEE